MLTEERETSGMALRNIGTRGAREPEVGGWLAGLSRNDPVP